MSQPAPDEETLAEAYLRQYATKSDDDFWAYKRVSELVRKEPQAGWRVTRKLVELAPSGPALAYVAAGPLEDIVNSWGNELRPEIEQEARAAGSEVPGGAKYDSSERGQREPSRMVAGLT
jgi:hypothetical protein